MKQSLCFFCLLILIFLVALSEFENNDGQIQMDEMKVSCQCIYTDDMRSQCWWNQGI